MQAYLEHGREVRQEVEITNSPVNQQFSKMHRVVETIADYIAQRFKVLANVRAVLVGKSGEVHHVWIMLNDWTAGHRKAVYAIQRDILSKLGDLNLDFYVIDIPEGVRPDEMVSGIPRHLFQRRRCLKCLLSSNTCRLLRTTSVFLGCSTTIMLLYAAGRRQWPSMLPFTTWRPFSVCRRRTRRITEREMATSTRTLKRCASTTNFAS